MAGINQNGLTIKRLGEVLADMRSDAQPIFQDLVPPDDVVDTSNSSTLGRLIALESTPIADLWEAVQEVYLAFDPNSATGIALDNLVMYGGLTRNPPSATTATVVIWGDENTFIPAGTSTVRALDNTLYDISISLELLRTRCIGFIAQVGTVVVGDVYSLSIGSETTSITVSVTAGALDTASTIIEALAAQLIPFTWLKSTTTTNSIQVETVDILDYIQITPTNLVITKIKSRTEVRNQVVGAKEQEANTIDAIATPMLGWDSVNNPNAAVVGEEEETDTELRIRFRDSKFLRAQNIADALYSALLELDGVRYAGVFENESGTYDPVYDLPGHSFKPIVLGGSPQDIAAVIWNNKPLGIASHGNTFATIFDSQGFQRDIYFERPENVDIYIDMEITVNANEFPSDGVDQIKSALVAYFQNTFSIGETVVYSRLYTPINSVPGHQVDSLTVGTTPSPTGMVNVPIAFNEIASLNTNNINITVS